MKKRYKVDNKCPHCTQAENNLHIIKCPTQHDQRQHFFQKMDLLLKHNKTEPGLSLLLIRALKGEPLQPLNQDSNKEWTRQLIQEQKKIGIDKMWLGHMTQTWGDIQEHTYRQTGQKAAYTGTRWARIILQQIFQYVLRQWEHRNQKLHQQLQSPAPYREAIQRDIKELYRKFEHTPEIFPRLYKHKLNDLLKKPMRYLLRWHSLMKTLDQYAEVQNKKRPGQDIRKYLHMNDKPPERRSNTAG